MAKERNYAWLIPVVLNLLVLGIMWDIFQETTLLRAALLTVAALGWPWLMYFVIGRLITHVAASRVKESAGGEDTDFI